MNKKKNFVKRYIRQAKKKPALLLLPALVLVIIIVLIIILASSGNKNEHPIDTEPETIEHHDAKLYDASKWKKDGQLMVYEDPHYKTSYGIDVSEWSLDIEWDKLKDQGIDFAICRVGYRGYETGKFVFDNNLASYLQGANDADIHAGVYFVTQAINEEEAIEEADEVLARIKDYKITMPIYIDCEENSGEDTRTDHLTKEDYKKIVLAFCKCIEEAGYSAGFYSNELWIHNHIDIEELSDYDIWVARYTDTPPEDIAFNMWQYTATGHLDGISTDVDMNIRLDEQN